MENIVPVLQETPLTIKVPAPISSWYETAWMSTHDPDQLPWLYAQGWVLVRSVTYTEQFQETYGLSIKGTWYLQRRSLKPEKALDSLVKSYTEAYNEGRQLNDQRYDDLIVLYSAVLSKSQDIYNSLESDDAIYEGLVESLMASVTSDHTAYSVDVKGSLDDYGDSMRTQINARFDSEVSKARQSLVDKGTYNTTVWTTTSSGIERERNLSLSDLEDKLMQQRLALKHKVYGELTGMRGRVMAARDRLRDTLHNSADRRLTARNTIVEALSRFVEARTDSYPDLAEIGKLASALGAGSPEAFSP